MFTGERFGRDQAALCADTLLNAFDRIADNPQIGRDMSAALPGRRRHLSGAHVIYYRIDEAGVFISRILHHAQDPIRAFEGDDD